MILGWKVGRYIRPLTVIRDKKESEIGLVFSARLLDGNHTRRI